MKTDPEILRYLKIKRAAVDKTNNKNTHTHKLFPYFGKVTNISSLANNRRRK